MKNELDDKELQKEIDKEIQKIQKEIIRLLKENNGEIEEKILCALLRITPYDIPWGHNIGWAKCLQPNQKYHLILSGKNSDADRV